MSKPGESIESLFRSCTVCIAVLNIQSRIELQYGPSEEPGGVQIEALVKIAEGSYIGGGGASMEEAFSHMLMALKDYARRQYVQIGTLLGEVQPAVPQAAKVSRIPLRLVHSPAHAPGEE